MKYKFDRSYLKICIYVLFTTVAIYLSIILINSIPTLLSTLTDGIKVVLRILKPLVMGLIIAYLLYEPTTAIENFLNTRKHFRIKSRSLCRTIGIVISYLTVLGIIAALLCGIYFMIGGQLSKNTTITNIINYITDYLNQNKIDTNFIQNQLQNLNITVNDSLSEKIASVLVWLQDYITGLINGLLGSVVTFGSNLMSLLIAFVLSIYLLKDSEYFKELWRKAFFLIFRESRMGKYIQHGLRVTDDTFSKYFKGQLTEACIVGILSTIVLMIIGIDYALIIGIISGICNMIPYIGPLVGTALAAIMALLSGSPLKVLYSIIGMQVVQQVDNNLLAPKVVGKSVGLHAVFTMMAIIIGGSQGGLIGMLIGVPIAATLKTLISDWYDENFSQKFQDSTYRLPDTEDLEEETEKDSE